MSGTVTDVVLRARIGERASERRKRRTVGTTVPVWIETAADLYGPVVPVTGTLAAMYWLPSTADYDSPAQPATPVVVQPGQWRIDVPGEMAGTYTVQATLIADEVQQTVEYQYDLDSLGGIALTSDGEIPYSVVSAAAAAAGASAAIPEARRVAGESASTAGAAAGSAAAKPYADAARADRITAQAAATAAATAAQGASDAGTQAAEAVVATKADAELAADGTPALRAITDRFADAINLEDFRFDANGVERSDDETVRAALLRVPRTVEVGRPVRAGARVYTFGGTSLSLLSKCSVEGVIGSTEFRVDPSNPTKNNIIYYDPTIAAADAAVAAAQAGGDARDPAVIRAEVMPGVVAQIMASPLPDLHWRGIRFRGNWGRPDPSNAGQYLYSESDSALGVIKCFENLYVEFCDFIGSRVFSFQPRIGRKAAFSYCKVEKSNRDGIAAWDVEDLIVTGCTFSGTTDDAISAQCSTDTGTFLRSRVTVSGCHFSDCHGINGGAAKLLRITNCHFDRLHAQAWSIGVSSNGTSGETQNFCIDVSNVTILDTVGRSWFVSGDGTSRPTAAMIIFNEHFKAADLAAVPGYNDPATGTVADNLPYYWQNRVELDNHPVGATKHIRISNFVIDRTRPAAAKYSDWRAETAGRADDPSGDSRYKAFGGTKGWLDYPVTDANLDGPGFDIRGPIWDMDVSNGYVGTRQKGVVFRMNPDITLRDMLFQRIRFSRVTFRGALQDAIAQGAGEFATPTQQDITFTDCQFDIDPEMKHSNRALTDGKPNGAWIAAGSPFAINLPNIGGVKVERCRFKNCGQVINDASTASLNYYRDNLLICDPEGPNFNASNKGIGVIRSPGETFWFEIWDCDPTSATFDTIRNQCSRQLNGSNGSIAAQVSGKYVAGMRVRNLDTTVTPEGMAGDWIRRTTGTTHAIGSDWVQVWQSFGQGDTPYANTLALRGSGSTNPQLEAVGTATNIDVQFTPKGVGTVVANAPMKPKSYTVATLPAVVSNTGAMITISDRDYRPAFSNGVGWVWADGTTVS